MDKNFQKELRDYKITPSAKPWEKIEAELNRNKKPSTFVIYSRWAAAASVALLVTAYLSWNPSNADNSVANTSTVPPKEIVSPAPQNTIDKPVTAPNNTTTIATTNANSSQKPLLQEGKNKPQQSVNQYIENKSKTNDYVAFVNPNKRNVEQNLATLKTDFKTLEYPTRATTDLDLPKISTVLIEDSRLYNKWKKVLSEDFSEESDSTFTERTLDIANKKAVALLKSNWKPALIEWIKLRKGF